MCAKSPKLAKYSTPNNLMVARSGDRRGSPVGSHCVYACVTIQRRLVRGQASQSSQRTVREVTQLYASRRTSTSHGEVLMAVDSAKR